GKYPLIGGAVFAILVGMLIGLFYKEKNSTQLGIKFTSKYILQLAVVFLGFGMNLSDVIKVGATSLPIIISTILTSLIVAYVLQKVLRIQSNTAILVGVGSSICGGSAIAATAPVIEAEDEEIAKAISVIFLFNILAALIFPSFGEYLGLSNNGFGLFAGTAINDTSSVTAAATVWDGIHAGANTLETATIVKLTRTLAIIPIVLTLAFIRLKKEKNSNSSVSIKKIFPYFVLFFILASIVTTVSIQMGASPAFFKPLKTLSKFFITMAMAGIGLSTDIVNIIKTGGKAIILGFCCWSAIATVSLLIQHLMQLV
ncbi:MAG: YeiH family protein, partial [Peptoniphilus sp.]|uniref:YeiH family protein n=1 Tax=Peptoniphilus sp. TaxID=1971214 RepID=UPI002A74E20C